MLWRQEPAQKLHTFGHRLLHIALHGHTGLHKLEGSQKERLELRNLRNNARPAHHVIGTQEGQALAQGIGEILLLLALQKRRSDDERRTKLLLVACTDKFHITGPVLPQIELRNAHPENLADVDEHTAEHKLVGGQIAAILALDTVVLVFLGSDGNDGLADVGEHQRYEAIFVGMEDILLPVLLSESRLHPRQAFAAVLLEETHLLGVGLFEIRQRRSHAPHRIVLAQFGVESSQSLQGQNHVLGILGARDDQAVFADRLLVALRPLHLVQLGQDLVA